MASGFMDGFVKKSDNPCGQMERWYNAPAELSILEGGCTPCLSDTMKTLAASIWTAQG